MYPDMRQNLLLEVQKRLAGEENLDYRQVTREVYYGAHVCVVSSAS